MKNIKIGIGAMLLLALITLRASGQIQFEEGELSEILQKAKQQKKMVFLDCYTSWCGPCKIMMKEVFTLKEVGETMNANFVCCKKDMEKGTGKALAKRYQVEVYPTFLLLDTAGTVIHRLVGGMQAEEFLKKVKEGLGEEALGRLDLLYAQGERNPEFIKLYIEKLAEAYKREESRKVMHQYWNTLSDTEKCGKDNWPLIKRFVHEVTSPEYRYLLDHKSDFEDNLGKEEVDQKIFADLEPLIGNHCNDVIFENRPEDIGLLRDYRRVVEQARVRQEQELLVLIDFTQAYIDGKLGKAMRIYAKTYSNADVDSRFSATLRLNGMLVHKGNATQCRKGLKLIRETMKEWKEDDPLFSAIRKGLNDIINAGSKGTA